MNNVRQAGFTLIELIMFIVIVSVGVVGILSVMNVTVQHSADPMAYKQAAALADSIMEEILLKEYDDPDGIYGETTRDTFDDVGDYDGISNAVFTDLPAALTNNYLIAITVDAPADLNGVTMKKVTVTVNRGSESISMTGYRASY